MKRSARIPGLLVWALAIALVASECSSGAPKGGGAGQNGKQDPLASVDPASLAPAAIVGKGPNGEQPGSPADLKLTDDEAAKAKAAGFKVGIVMQTMDIDWSKLQVAGITDTPSSAAPRSSV
jgi:ribose transport system substrate-binding protein